MNPPTIFQTKYRTQALDCPLGHIFQSSRFAAPHIQLPHASLYPVPFLQNLFNVQLRDQSETLDLARDRAETCSQPSPPRENLVTNSCFLTPEEVYERYRGAISAGTLRNWRAMRIGPSFVKLGKAVLYPLDELEAWDKKNRVQCREPKLPLDHDRE